MQYEHLDSKERIFLTGCLLNAVFFFQHSESVCFRALQYLCESPQLYCGHPLQPGTMSALGSRDLGHKAAKAKSRRGVFPRPGWKVRLKLGSHGDTGIGRGGRQGKEREIYFCSLAARPVRRPMYQKDHRIWDEPVNRYTVQYRPPQSYEEQVRENSEFTLQ